VILMIDNYDSFSYNLYQLIGSVNEDIRVIRNDEMSVNEIEALQPEFIVISPGPGKPADAGICVQVVKEFGSRVPILGVCLGHQAICEAFGATVSYAKELMHGKSSMVVLDTNSTIFQGLPKEVMAARYHSLAVLEETMPECLKVTATTEDGEIMAVEHKEASVYGLQFHPESVLTPTGIDMIQNFLRKKR